MEEQNKELEEKNAQQQKHIDEIDTLLGKVRGIIILPSLSFTQFFLQFSRKIDLTISFNQINWCFFFHKILLH